MLDGEMMESCWMETLDCEDGHGEVGCWMRCWMERCLN